MSTKRTKITDARIEQLGRITKRKDEMRAKLCKVKQTMEEILHSMCPKTRQLIVSSTRASRQNRSQDAFILDLEDEIEAQDLAAKRLDEHYAKFEKELADLKDMMGKA
jgi:ABC-type Fe3+-citrate transport system substrate-binding protein